MDHDLRDLSDYQDFAAPPSYRAPKNPGNPIILKILVQNKGKDHLFLTRVFSRRSFGRRMAPVILAALLAAAAIGPRPASPVAVFEHLANRKVSGVIPEWSDVRFASHQISPDGAYAVFVADVQVDDADELYSVSLRTRADPVRLSPLVPAGRGPGYFAITPDSR